MANLSDVLEKIIKTDTVVFPSFAVDDRHVLDPAEKKLQFKKDEVYFEIRICEHFLKEKRKYWQDWNPLTIVLSEFIYDKQKRSFPFVVGPDLLKSIEELQGNESVRYSNTRVVGPTPYCGDQLALFVGLFRVEGNNWAKQTLNLLEGVAKAFDNTKLTGYINISAPILAGIEGFLGMGDKTQLRLGKREEFTDPSTPAGTILTPGYFVMIRDKRMKLSEAHKRKFWVRNNRLYYGDKESDLEPYSGNDYILYQITCHDVRKDIDTFDFHKHWEVVKKAIWKSGVEEAQKEYLHLIELLRGCPDLITPQMNLLQFEYRGRVQVELAAKQKAMNPFTFEPLKEKAATRSFRGVDVDSADIRRGIEDVVSLTNKFLEEGIKKKKSETGSFELEEGDLQKMFESSSLDKSLIVSVDRDQLAGLLSIETPFKAAMKRA